MIKIIIIITKFIIAITTALLLNSCNIKTDFGNEEKGNGNTTTEVRTIDKNFESIDVDSAIEVVLEQSAQQFVSVEADSNLHKLIDTKVYKGILYISPNSSYSSTKTIKVVVRMPKIEGLDASSSSKIKGIGTFKGENISVDASSSAEIDVNLEFDNISLDSSSASSIKVKGIALKLETSASSGSEIEAVNLLVNQVNADASSGAKMQIHPIVNLVANASSGGSITFAKNPKTISIEESSGGSVGRE